MIANYLRGKGTLRLHGVPRVLLIPGLLFVVLSLLLSSVGTAKAADDFQKKNPDNLGLVVAPNLFHLGWSDAGIDLEDGGPDSDRYQYCIDESPGTTCTTEWVPKKALKTAEGDIIVQEWHTYYWQVRTQDDFTYADCETCWFSFTAVPSSTTTISGSASLPGVTMGYTGSTTGSTTSGAGGTYSITVPMGWSGTVTPVRTGYSFTPPSISYLNVTTAQINQNYTPAVSIVYYISGNVGVAGATLTYTGGTATSASNGSYSFTVPSGWSGSVTPSLTGYAFFPGRFDYVSVMANQLNQDFTAAPAVPEGGTFISTPSGGVDSAP